MTAPGILLEVLDGAAVGIFGILLSAAFCPIRWTGKKRWALAGCTAGLLALQGMFYFGASPTAAKYLYPLITHLPLYVVLVLLSGQKVWPLVAVLTAYLCCQVRRWAALAVALFFPQHPLVQPVAELLFTLPLLLLFIRFLAPSMRQLSRYPASVQCQFGIVPLVSYLFDYITHVYTSLLSEANPAAVEFMFFVCCAAFLCSILRASRVERQRIQMEQLQTSLNLQVTQAMREIEALRLSQQRASTYRHDLRHHMQFLAGCIENGRTEQALGYIRSVCSEIEAGKVTVYCENEAANLIFSAFARPRRQGRGTVHSAGRHLAKAGRLGERSVRAAFQRTGKRPARRRALPRSRARSLYRDLRARKRPQAVFADHQQLSAGRAAPGWHPGHRPARPRAWGAQHLRHLGAVRRPDQLCRKGRTIHPAGNVIR